MNTNKDLQYKIIGHNKTNKPTIRGDIAKHTVGSVVRVQLKNDNTIYENVTIKDIVHSFTDEYLDDYYIVDLPRRRDLWLVISEVL